MQSWKGIHIVYLLILIFLTSCSSTPKIQKSVIIEDLTSSNQVKRGIHLVDLGESLYSIAFRYGRDYRNLAAINGLQYPYKIVPGQTIYLHKADYKPLKNNKKVVIARKKPLQQSMQSKITAEKNIKKQYVKSNEWVWPLNGKVISGFGGKKQFNKGLDLAVNHDTAVKASNNGVVVYKGTGLKGYGKLIIIKHSEQYLSAYAHNDQLLVTEGQIVKKGESIARIGRNEKVLHYEIRKNGKPVNPTYYLPKT